MRSLLAAALLAAVLPACGDKRPEPPDISEVFPNLPLPPGARLVSRAGGEDVLQLVFTSPSNQGQVEAYYRSVFSGAGWRLVSGAKDRQGAMVLLAEQDGPPLWVRILPTDGGGTTVVELSGAKVRPGS